MNAEEGKRWSNIIKTHSCGIRLNETASAFVRGVLRSTSAYVAISLTATHFSVESSSCGRYSCKLINAHVNGKMVPLTKSKLSGKVQTNREKALGAMRHMVKADIDNYRKQRAKTLTQDWRCPLSGKPLAGNKTHVDHIGLAFADLVDDWCKENNIDLNSVATNVYAFKDLRLTASWQAYHTKNAELALVLASANLKKGRQPRKP